MVPESEMRCIRAEKKGRLEYEWDWHRLRMKFVSIESGIASAGFRKLAAIAKEIVPDIEICFIPTDNLYSFKSHFFPEKESAAGQRRDHGESAVR